MSAVKIAYDKGVFWATTAALLLSAGGASAQGTGGTGTTVDPAAPIEILKQAGQKVSSSNMSASTAQSALATGGLLVAAIFGVLGLGAVGYGLFSLFSAHSDVRSQEQKFHLYAAVVIGALVTISSIVVQTVVYFLYGSSVVGG